MPYTEEDLNQLEIENEAMSKKVSLEEKRALIKEAKKRYGKDYMKFFSKFIGKGSGIDWSSLKFNLNR